MLFIIIVCLPLFSSINGKEEIIAGGNDVRISSHPYQVLMTFMRFSCGGSLISKNFVVTAAHCIEFPANKYFVKMGTDHRRKGGVEVGVKSIVIHPQYKLPRKGYDIAILELMRPVQFSSTIKPIALPSADERLEVGTIVTVTGFGALHHKGKGSLHLQGVQLETISNEECQKTLPKKRYEINDVMLCATVADGSKDACQGDSGGPLEANSKLFGVISFGIGCATKFPGVYTYVPLVRDFIANVTGL